MREKYLKVSMENSDPTLHTPEEKLRKISFDASELDEFPIIIKNKERELKVDGWGNENWDLKTEEIINKPKSRKSFSRNESDRNQTSSTKKQPTLKDTPISNNRTKYIEKLEEKLVELVETKTQKSNNLEVKKNENYEKEKHLPNSFIPHYLTPQKLLNEKTTSTSESDCDNNKCEHNFTSTLYRKSKDNNKQKSFSIRKKSSREDSQNKIVPDIMEEFNLKELINRSVYDKTQKKMFAPYTERSSYQNENRTFNNKSMIDSYEKLTKKTQEVSMISYPVIDQERMSKRVPKINKLNEFFERFQSRNSKNKSEHSKDLGFSNSKKLRIHQNEQEECLFRIKVTEPLENKRKSFRIIE